MTHKSALKIQTKSIIYLFLLIFILFLLVYAQLLFAAGKTHSNETIRAAAAEFVRAQIPDNISIRQITAGKIDSRIRFKQCSQALETRSTANKSIAKSWTVGVRCPDEPGWNIYVPVKADLLQKMLVSKTTITRGEIITAGKIQLVEKTVTNANQKHFSTPENIIGREARRTIRSNRVINSSMLQQAYLVRKKESVLIYAGNEKLRISMQGTAMKNGRYNEMVRVRNNSSKKIIEALVIDRGVVAVSF